MKVMRSQRSEPRGQKLAVQVREILRGQIADGIYLPGQRLPTEAKLTLALGVSRTVLREAVAALQSEGVLEPRHGSGVFVLPIRVQTQAPFRSMNFVGLSALIEMIELRIAVEGDSAALAARRRTPAQEEKIVEALERVRTEADSGKPTAEADFLFHVAVAEAANNPRFSELLEMIGVGIIPRNAISGDGEADASASYLLTLDREHSAVVAAIQARDEAAARGAMRMHLTNSLNRYSVYLRAARRSALP
jgi:GntR family transcriptional repressor for pyruvate dehydrogenase complex